MSLTDQSVTQMPAENITELTFITTPVTVNENGEVVQQAYVQHVATSEQENIDPQSQVLMLQPLTMGGGAEQNNMGMVSGTQFQIIDQSVLDSLQMAAVQENQVLQLSQDALQQVHILSQQDTPQDVTTIQLSDLTPQQQQMILQQVQQAQQQQPLQEHQLNTQESGMELIPIQTFQGEQLSPEPPPFKAPPTPVRPRGRPPKGDTIKPPVGKGPFKCEVCDKVFPKWGAYQRHVKGHEDDKPFRCIKCPETFNVEGNLRLHLAIHDTESPQCPECNKKFSRIASLKAHIMLHEKEENLVCNECGDEFSIQNQLDRHMAEHRQESEESKSYPCRQCTMEFGRLSQLREHMKQHYKIKNSLSHRHYKRNVDRSHFSHKCNSCDKTFQKPSQLQRHLRIHTGERPYKCDICDKAFNQKGALQIHMTKHTGERPYTCEFCQAKFAQRGNLRAHIQRVHNHTQSGDSPTFHCEECTCVFRKLGSLNAHMSRAHSDTQSFQVLTLDDDPLISEVHKHSGEDQKVVLQQLLELSEHVKKNQTSIIKIPEQQLGSDILQQALEHTGLTTSDNMDDGSRQPQTPGGSTEAVTVSTATAADGTTTTTITTADGITTSGNIQSLHTATNHVESVNEAISVLADMKPPRGIITTMAIHDSATGTIKRHIIRKVNGVRWHQCVYCTKEFKKPSDLIRHIRIHTHEKPYKCTQCFRSFAVKSTLTAHLKTHSGVKEFKCQVCDKHFSTQGSLKVHLRLHTGLKPFDCPHCDKRFRTSGHRKTHLQSHFKHPSPKKARKMMRRLSKPEINLPDVPLQEPILITETGLIQQPPRSQIYPHQYLGEAASMDRPYKCPHCSRAFKKSSHLKQHERSHTGEKPYKCVTCLKAFVSSGVLKAHVRTHTGVKAYKCMICDTNFTTNGSLKRHMSTHSEMRPFMCPYCQKTFKTSVNCKKHMKTHMQELAMQAMQEVGYTQPAEIEVTVDTEVADTANDEDDDDVGVPTEVHTQLEVTSAGDLVQYQNTQLGQEHQAAALTLEQQELGQPMTLLSQQQGMQDALVTDVQLQNALNSQNVCHQVLEPSNALTVPLQPQALPQQSLLAQSLLQTSQAGLMASSQQQSLLSINPSQLSLQSQMIPGSLEMPQHLNLTHPNTSITTNQECISIQNILQTKEGELVSDDPKQLEALLQEEIHTAPDDVTIAAMTATTDTRSHSRKFHCQFCGKLFKKSSHMKQHERTHTGEKPYRCLQCNRSFVSSGVLKSHLKTHLGVKSHRCQICQSTFTTNGSLTRHMMIHSSLRPFKCPFCNETFRTTLLCRRHMKSHKEMYSMDDESDTRPYNTRRSRSSVIQISEEQTEELLKTRLDETMSVSERLLIESAAEKEKLSLTESQQLRDMALPNKCHFCAKSFKKPSDLVRHVRIHTGEKPFMCVTCGRSFTVKSTLDSHMKTHKPGDKRFRCHVCNACFSTKGSLKVHMRLHTGAKPFKCMMCPQRFRTSGHRKSHILQHSKPPHIKKRKAERLRATAEATTNIQVGLGGIEMDGSQILQGQSLVQVPGQVEGLMQNQVINIDQSMLQGMPLSLTFPDTLGQVNDNNFATQVLQGLEGVQLQLNPGSLGQGIQISGLDPSVFNQPVQIDASLLQQLQQQGSISLTINPQVINQAIQGVDPNQIQNVQLSQQGHVGLADVMNPNVVIQPGTIEQPQETHEVLQTVMKVEPDADLAQQQTVVMEAMGTVEATEPQTESVILQAALKAVEEDEEEEEEEEGEEDDDDGEEEEEAVHYVQVGEDGQLHQFTLSGDGEATATGVDATTLQLLSQQDDPERSYMCAICSKRFKRSGHLKEHMLTHTGESPARLKHKLHKCTECEKGFAKPSQLERHIRIHTGERPYLCEVCHKSFNQKNALQVHLKGKHSGEKPHQCPYCELAFTQKGNLKTHVKRAHHQEMVMSMNLPIVVINPDGVQDADEAAVGDPGVKEPEEPGAGATVNLDDVLPFEHVA